MSLLGEGFQKKNEEVDQQEEAPKGISN